MRSVPLRPAAALLAALGGLTATAGAAPGAAPAGTEARAARPAAVVEVGTADELEAALAAVVPGDTIRLADGEYRGNFDATRSGSASEPITLVGSRDAVLTAGGGYGLHLDGAAHWRLTGFTVTGGQKGIVMDAADDVHIDDVLVHTLTMEAVHWRNSSSDGSITNSTIRDTGLDGRGMGEGVYVGSAGGTDDRSDNILIRGNTLGPGIGGENIDVKEGTTGTRIIDNTFDGSGLTGANFDDSWVDIKGNDVLVEGNTGTRTTNDGFQTHQVRDGWGCGTVFRANHADLTGATGPDRYAINVTHHDPDACPVTVAADNTVEGGNGLTNPGVPVG
ncbi:sheath polysaccharide-degrading enzyme [Streptomyces sp. 3MP-14]|uniref:Sheath polysaccharide-degrading enzyme n=1 Tax=Streptomyces mimosae TaxID=2586635 RepID=A0A5N6A5W8_9ACTN|nr:MULTISPECIES: right-handed parallel beta-helix repeat-containing protein [Streptomyces]KAB8163775.1 sheath polysaccharide-degrading enzyme [Streptomyces mimosae]KAB8175218.1 sheath polysaccharide-degrading enzyme [Streptomyces sp. 3MP-14]